MAIKAQTNSKLKNMPGNNHKARQLTNSFYTTSKKMMQNTGAKLRNCIHILKV